MTKEARQLLPEDYDYAPAVGVQESFDKRLEELQKGAASSAGQLVIGYGKGGLRLVGRSGLEAELPAVEPPAVSEDLQTLAL